MRQMSRFCRSCQQNTLHQQHQMVSDGMGCLLSILTVGLFLPVWILLAFIDVAQPKLCQRCGTKN